MAHDHDDDATPHVPGDCPWTHLRDLGAAVLAGDWLSGWRALAKLLAHASTCEAPPPALMRAGGTGREAVSRELDALAAEAEAGASASWLDALLMLLPAILEFLRRKP